MSTLKVKAVLTDENGNTATWTGDLQQQRAPTLTGSVVPASAIAGTTRTITLTGADVDGGVLTYTCEVETAEGSNIFTPATPTAQPNVFTVVR